MKKRYAAYRNFTAVLHPVFILQDVLNNNDLYDIILQIIFEKPAYSTNKKPEMKT